MELADRIRSIISENKIKQKEFALSINVTESYISKLLRGESGISTSTAALIEEKYGYCANWILHGMGPIRNAKNGKELTPLQSILISEIERMNQSELMALKTFIELLREYQSSANPES